MFQICKLGRFTKIFINVSNNIFDGLSGLRKLLEELGLQGLHIPYSASTPFCFLSESGSRGRGGGGSLYADYLCLSSIREFLLVLVPSRTQSSTNETLLKTLIS